MRKLLVLLCGIVLLIGCAHKRVQTLAANFSCTFAGEYEGMAIEGELCRENAGTLSLGLTAPQSVKGLRFLCENGNVQILLDDLVYPTDEMLPVNALPTVLVSILDDLLQTDGATTQRGRTPAGDVYTAEMNAETGYILTLQSQGQFLLRLENIQETEIR